MHGGKMRLGYFYPLYGYFPSKDDLVVAYLEERNRRFWALFDSAVNKHPSDPKAQLRL
ncbi:hypothetical protein NIES4073_50760 [Kalymmatonema gypsitolerans NIES-4073]|nr:hypothetical protein NIES4073_50760 [Scytonema sp. NIES-4073]